MPLLNIDQSITATSWVIRHMSSVLLQEVVANRPFIILGTGPLLGQALPYAWDRPTFGTGPSVRLGHARSWDRPFYILVTGQNIWTTSAL